MRNDDIELAIFEKSIELKRLKRKRTAQVLDQINKEFEERQKLLEDDCEKATSHVFRHTGSNWTRDYDYYACNLCGKHKSVKVQ